MTRFGVVLHNARQALIALDQFGNAMVGLLAAVFSFLRLTRRAVVGGRNHLRPLLALAHPISSGYVRGWDKALPGVRKPCI